MTMLRDTDALSIIQFHDLRLNDPRWPDCIPPDIAADAWHWIDENHRYNTLLWNEEDKARRTDVGPEEIAASKRLIDRYNQKRNDAVEVLDETLLIDLQVFPRMQQARQNSETAGAMIDRLSILSLKIYHMRVQTCRDDVGREHIRKCEVRLVRLIEQRGDLGACLDQLLEDAFAGRAYFKIYRQFKMYNDPALNPWLYGRPAPRNGQGAPQ
jgi:hypothetical protein